MAEAPLYTVSVVITELGEAVERLFDPAGD